MPKIDITKTELVWPGKYNDDGTLKEVPRIGLPFQVIETVNESHATREARKGGFQQSLFDIYEGKEGVTFGEMNAKPVMEQALYEYLAFILKLYGARPLHGMKHLHGKKGGAMVRIGAVDAPVTIGEINAAVDECLHLKQREIHILGWEWEMGLAGPNNEVRRGGPMHQSVKARGAKLFLLQIPREVMEQQAVDKGDVRFFELAYLDAAISKPKKHTVQVALKDFVIPNAELIPNNVRSKVRKWSDYIDYWAVDWNFRNDTFMQGWVAYRTRKERTLSTYF